MNKLELMEKRSNLQEELSGIIAKGEAEKRELNEAETSRMAEIKAEMDSLDEEILSLIRKNGRITVPEIAAVTGRPGVTVYRHIRALADAGKVRRTGARKNGSWEITG